MCLPSGLLEVCPCCHSLSLPTFLFRPSRSRHTKLRICIYFSALALSLSLALTNSNSSECGPSRTPGDVTQVSEERERHGLDSILNCITLMLELFPNFVSRKDSYESFSSVNVTHDEQQGVTKIRGWKTYTGGTKNLRGGGVRIFKRGDRGSNFKKE